MAKKKLGNPGSPPKPRRPTGYWRVFNAWWRDRLESTGRRPTVEEMTAWYRSNALLVWGPKDLPPIEDMKQLSKGMRSTKNVRAYFQEYRAAKKKRAQGGGSPIRRVSVGRVNKPTRAAKPRRGRGRRTSSSSSEDEGPDYGAESETTDMEDEVVAQLVEDVEEVTAGDTAGDTAARQAYNVACAASLMAAAAAAAAAARAMHAPTAGFESQAGTSGGAQESDQEALCYTPQPDVEDFGASLAHQGSWLQSVQEAAATTALDPAGLGFTQPPAAHTGGSHAPSPAGAAISPPMPSAICTMPSAPACEGAAAPHLPRHQLGGQCGGTAGSAPLRSYGSVPPPPLPPHVQYPPAPPPYAGYPAHPAYPHGYSGYGGYGSYGGYGYPPYGMPPPPPYGYAPAPYGRYSSSASAPPPPPYAPPPYPYPYGHGMPPGYPQYGHLQQPAAAATAQPHPHLHPHASGPAASHEEAGNSLTSFHDDVDLDAVLEAEMGDYDQQVQQQQQQATRPSEGGQTDAFADLWVRWEEDTGADAAPAVCKDATASGPGMQPRTRVPVHVFHE